MFPNPFAGPFAGLSEALSGVTDAFKAEFARRINGMRASIDPERSPLAHAAVTRGDTIVDILDGLAHAVAELEKRLPEKGDKAA